MISERILWICVTEYIIGYSILIAVLIRDRIINKVEQQPKLRQIDMWIWKSDLIKWEQKIMEQIPKKTKDIDYWYLKGELFAVRRLKRRKIPI